MAPHSLSMPIRRAGLPDAAADATSMGTPASCTARRSGDVQGERTAGERVGPGQAGLAVGHPDVQATDEEVPVAHAGGPDGVGDEDHAPGHAGHQGW